MTQARTRVTEAVREALQTAFAGDDLTAHQVETLLRAGGDDLDALLDAAGELRDRGLAEAGRSGIITYSRKVFVPLTTLCRDRCHYCVFVDTPGQLQKLHKPLFMSPDQVLSVVAQGQAMGCKEVLLTLGDNPEDRWPQARQWLDEHGHASTIDYVAATAAMIIERTGLLPHANPGVITAEGFARLRPVAPSMGMMLETTSRQLFETPGQVHHGSPDKDPALRLQVIEDAGRAGVPFTTGLLIGIGETVADRAESLLALRELHRRYGHIQEVIIQNFRAKPRTAMRDVADAEFGSYLAAVATARIVFGPAMRIQVPPNLSDPAELGLLLRAGADDWGGVSPLTADHVNPERPWPHLDELGARTSALGFTLRERLTAQPEYVLDAARWIDPGLRPAVAALADPQTGLARTGPTDRPRPDRPGATGTVAWTGNGASEELADLLGRAAADPTAPSDADWVRLLQTEGEELQLLTETADDVRRYTVGEAISMVVNRNLTSTGLTSDSSMDPSSFTLDQVGEIAADAWQLGATEICVQGLLGAERDPLDYLRIVEAIKQATPRMHVHAYRPADVADLAARGGLGLDGALQAMREAGVNTVPGTGVKVLSERVRQAIAPGDCAIADWTTSIIAAHRAGFGSTSVLFYGHVEEAAERVAHLRELRRIQALTGGFNEFVPIPLPGHRSSLVSGRSELDEHRAMVAVSRLLLSGAISHIQIPWTRLGAEQSAVLLGSGGDDLGGTLLDGRVRPRAGIEYGHEFPLARGAQLAARLMRPFRQRTTDYREPDPDRKLPLR
ncbi:7,8-didemethyl-8-hydroxy-5-deazariboflavin synthase CofG [Naumannella halotolerans]|uniref:7,8-didemethyl-8-hydroxy-5-deazariboflavin synthase CofG n=1 Tax=Naumannella halotolerans TaxID=993414 RepID=UPI00370D42D5